MSGPVLRPAERLAGASSAAPGWGRRRIGQKGGTEVFAGNVARNATRCLPNLEMITSQPPRRRLCSRR